MKKTVKIERTKKDIVAKQLAAPQFHQRIVEDKKKYKRKKMVDTCGW